MRLPHLIRSAFCALTLLAPLSLQAQQAMRAPGGTLRILDKTAGTWQDVQLLSGETRQIGLLRVDLKECRYPAGNPSGDAWAALEIRYEGTEGPIFRGWMVASAPALNALDHPRYDVWVLRCQT